MYPWLALYRFRCGRVVRIVYKQRLSGDGQPLFCCYLRIPHCWYRYRLELCLRIEVVLLDVSEVAVSAEFEFVACCFVTDDDAVLVHL